MMCRQWSRIGQRRWDHISPKRWFEQRTLLTDSTHTMSNPSLASEASLPVELNVPRCRYIYISVRSGPQVAPHYVQM